MKIINKWIIATIMVVVVCVVGKFVRERYSDDHLIDGQIPVDYSNFNLESDSKVDAGRVEYIVKVNLNTATVDQLEQLPKIGKSTAEEIIAYRNDYGDFINIEEIKSVKGIGDKTYESIKEYITVE